MTGQLPDWIIDAAQAGALNGIRNPNHDANLRELRRAMAANTIQPGTVVIYGGSYASHHGLAVYVGPSGNYPAGEEIRHTLIFSGLPKLEGVGRGLFIVAGPDDQVPADVRKLAETTPTAWNGRPDMTLTTYRIDFTAPEASPEPLTVVTNRLDTVTHAIRYHLIKHLGTNPALIGYLMDKGTGDAWATMETSPGVPLVAKFTFRTEPGPTDVEVGANAELAGTTHCPTCGSPEWNPVNVECEDCAAEVEKFDGLLDILESAGDGGTYVELCAGDFDRPTMRRADETDLPEQLLAWRDAAVKAAIAGLGLKPEYGILRYTEPLPGPNVMPAENAALAVDIRADGVFEPDRTYRPGRLMQRKATDWEEIPADVTPDDILPGYGERKAAAAREAES